MPIIRFKKDYPALLVIEGTNLMRALLEAGLPVASSCHGDGVCAKCRIEIIEGQDNLSNPNQIELNLKNQHAIKDPIRISCQTKILGDIVVDTGYW